MIGVMLQFPLSWDRSRFSLIMVILFHTDQHLVPQGTILAEGERSCREPESEQHFRELCLPWVMPPEFLLQGREWASAGFPFPCPWQETQVCGGGWSPCFKRSPPSSSWWGEGAGCDVWVCEGNILEASMAVNFLYLVPGGTGGVLSLCGLQRSQRASRGRGGDTDMTSSVTPCCP